MKETTYKCDYCREIKKEDEIVPYYVNSDNEINLMEDADRDEYDNHICKSCIEKAQEFIETKGLVEYRRKINRKEDK